jgi:hypothetical protein
MLILRGGNVVVFTYNKNNTTPEIHISERCHTVQDSTACVAGVSPIAISESSL